MEIRNTKLHPDQVYHIFNRGINGAPVFFEERNYQYLLRQYAKYVEPFVKTYAYCLISNHFHFMIRVRSESELSAVVKEEISKPLYWYVSNGFSSLFQTYTRAMNKMYNRTGALFESPFKRIKVTEESYFSALIAYIHRNPERHKLVNNFRGYEHSSYKAFVESRSTKIDRQEVLDWFGGKESFVLFHNEEDIKNISSELLLE